MDKKLDLYAQLILKQGVNLEKGEMLAISCPVEAAELAEKVAEYAYKAGARKVVMFWTNPLISKYGMEYQSDEEIVKVPDHVVASRDYLIEEKAAYLNIITEEPDLYKDISPERMKNIAISNSKALKRFRDSTSSNKTRWCLAAYPNKEWAHKVFPDMPVEKAVDKLWEFIHKTLYFDFPDALAEWKNHEDRLTRRSKILNDAKITYLRYKSGLGTDFRVGMPKGYVFTGAVEESAYGRNFTANLPTEEVFSSPDFRKADGKVVASLPLVRRGAVIKDFFIEFKDGKAVNYGAKEGYDTLKSIIETDEGSHYLGEVALVGYNSPIQKLKTLFYNTLFDENASCHLAIGRGFSACLQGGLNMEKDELTKHGINDSLEHVDFMIGTKDLSIIAETESGKEMVIFKDGDWVI